MRKTSAPASYKWRIRCSPREAGPRVATIFTRRRRRMLSPSRSWPSQHDALCAQQTGERLCVAVGGMCTYDEYATHARVCTARAKTLATTLAHKEHAPYLEHPIQDVRQNCLP